MAPHINLRLYHINMGKAFQNVQNHIKMLSPQLLRYVLIRFRSVGSVLEVRLFLHNSHGSLLAQASLAIMRIASSVLRRG